MRIKEERARVEVIAILLEAVGVIPKLTPPRTKLRGIRSPSSSSDTPQAKAQPVSNGDGAAS